MAHARPAMPATLEMHSCARLEPTVPLAPHYHRRQCSALLAHSALHLAQPPAPRVSPAPLLVPTARAAPQRPTFALLGPMAHPQSSPRPPARAPVARQCRASPAAVWRALLATPAPYPARLDSFAQEAIMQCPVWCRATARAWGWWQSHRASGVFACLREMGTLHPLQTELARWRHLAIQRGWWRMLEALFMLQIHTMAG